MLKAIIVEDEEDSLKLLHSYLKECWPQLDIIALCGSVSAAVDAIALYKPDVVFLDIELNGETSFDMLARLDNIPFEIIFTTAHEHHALRALKLSATDYLLKPINKDELMLAIQKTEEKINSKHINKNLGVLLNNLQKTQADPQIAVPTLEGYQVIKVSNIIYLASDGAYTHLHLSDQKKITSSRHLKEYEEILGAMNFFRIHKSYIINIQKVDKYIRGDGGYVVMINHAILDVSRRKKEEFIKMLTGERQ